MYIPEVELNWYDNCLRGVEMKLYFKYIKKFCFYLQSECAFCHRCLPISELKLLGPHMRRHCFGDRNINDTSIVCSSCFAYLQPKSSGSWAKAWPAILFTFLTNKDFANEKELILNSLDPCIKNMYKNVCTSESDKQRLHTLGTFEDITKRREFFFNSLNSGDKHKFVRAFRLHEVVPTVRCPAGCCAFVDDEFLLVPFVDFIASQLPNFRKCQGNPDNLSGARSDFLRPAKLCGRWVIKPATIMDNEKGLCIAVCKKHDDLTHKFVHVPTNPFINSGLIYDRFPYGNPASPCMLSSNIVRKSTMNIQNASFPVALMKGNSTGLGTATFSAPVSLSRLKLGSHQRVASIVMSAKGRPDIERAIKQGKNALIDALDLETFYGRAQRNPSSGDPKKEFQILASNAVEESFSGSTYVPFNEALILAKAQSGIHESSSKANFVKNFAVTVREYGSNPPTYPSYANNRNFPVSKFHAAFSLFKSMVNHNSSLRSDIQSLSCSDGASNLEKGFSETLKPSRIFTNYFRIEEREISDMFKSHLINQGITKLSSESISSLVLKLFESFNLKMKVLDIYNADVNELLTSNEDYVIFVHPHPEETAYFPIDHGDYHLMVAGSSELFQDRNVPKIIEKIVFRDSYARTVFYSAVSSNSRKSIPCDVGAHNLYIYVRKCKLVGLNEGESINLFGGQRKIKCFEHRDEFLINSHKEEGKNCSKYGCRCQVSLKCPNENCNVCLCKKHVRERNVEYGVCYVRHEGTREDAALPVIVEDEENYEDQNKVLFEALEADDPPTALFNNQVYEPILSKPSSSNIIADPTRVNSCYLFNQAYSSSCSTRSLKSVPQSFNKIVNSLHSVVPEHSQPLLYSEGMCKVEHFSKVVDDAVVGALPSCLFGKYGETSHPHGLASLDSHIMVRMLDLTTAIARDPDMHSFYFDALLNRGIPDNAPIKIFKCGLEFCTEAGVQSKKDNRDVLTNEWQVQKLASQFKDLGGWSVFFTFTANNSATPGLAEIRQAIEELYPNDSKNQLKEIENHITLFARVWERYIRYLVQTYILESPAEPLGPVRSVWMRFEFQNEGSKGNLPHVHGGIILKPGADKEKVHQKISCIPDFADVCGCSVDDLTGPDKMFETRNEFYKTKEIVVKGMSHDCNDANKKCQRQTSKKDGSIEYHCRVQNHPQSFKCTKTPKTDLYTNPTIDTLVDLGLARIEDGEIVLDEKLQPYIYNYPHQGNHKGIPVVAELSYILRSSSNIQMCDYRFCVAYVLKYAAGSDEKRDVALFLRGKDNNEVDVEVYNLYHSKISGAAIAERKRREKLDKEKTPMWKEIAHTEIVWYLLKNNFVWTNVSHVTVDTNPFDTRSAIIKFKNSNNLLDDSGQIKTITIRDNLPEWRRFTSHQIEHIENSVKGNYAADNLTRFNVRAPEYRSIDSVENYLRWIYFHKSPFKCPDKSYSIVVGECPITDGLGATMKIRERYLSNVLQHFIHLNESSPSPGSAEMLELCNQLHARRVQPDGRDAWYSRYVDFSDQQEVIIVYNFNKVTNPEKFILNFIIRFGRFICEHQLFSEGDIHDAFQKAGLVADKNNITEEEVRSITYKYVNYELAHLPLTKRKFEYYLKSAVSIFKNFLIHKVFNSGNPICLQTMLQVAATEELQRYESKCKEKSIEKIRALIPSIPNPLVPFEPSLPQLEGQSDESYNEKKLALALCKESIDQLSDPRFSRIDSPFLIGPPGSGKSYILFLMCAYAMSIDRNVCLLAYTSVRAQAIGGTHMHQLFCIPVLNIRAEMVSAFVEKSMESLHRSPLKYAFLKRLAIIFFDEIGLISREQLHIMDKILRQVKDCPDKPFGSALLIASGDHMQLEPIDGTMVFDSYHLFSSVKVICMIHLVRSMQDSDLQRFITLTRTPRLSGFERREIRRTLKRRCKQNTVSTIREVPPGCLLVVGKRAAEREINDLKLKELEEQDLPHFKSIAKDEIRLGNSVTWQTASQKSTRDMNQVFEEQSEILIYPDIIYQFTANNPQHKPPYSQGQKVLVTSVPNEDANVDTAVIKGKLLPPGVLFLRDDELTNSFDDITLRCCKSRDEKIGRAHNELHCRRTQFQLKYYFSSTAHRIIGETMDQLATVIEFKKKSKYSLWLRSQLQVIVSRVRNLDNLIFVGNWDKDIDKAIDFLLKQCSPAIEHINKKIMTLNVLNNDPKVIEAFNGVLPQCAYVPADNFGYILLAISVFNPEVNEMYIVEDIQKHLEMMNSGASLGIDTSFNPYIAGFFITGFRQEQLTFQNFSERFELKERLESNIFFCKRQIQPFTWQTKIAVVEYAMRHNHPNYTFVICVKIPDEVKAQVRQVLDEL